MPELCVLGPTLAREHGLPVALRPRERDVLAALALEHPSPMSASSIVEVVWPVAPPRTARVTLQNHVARLRRALGDGAVVTEAGAYRLGASWTLDSERFELALARARRWAAGGDHEAARVGLHGALSLVRGHAFDDLPESDRVRSTRERHLQLRLAAEDELALAMIATGELATVIAAMTSHVAVEPLREVRWMILAVALYRDGQRRESIEALQRGRAALRELSGLDAGPAMSVLETLILDDDRSVLAAPPATLVGVDPSAHAVDGIAQVFVGRDDVLADVRSILDAAQDERRATSIHVSGVAGIGKTALVDRVAVHAAIDGWHVVRAEATPVASRPLEPLGEVVRQALEHDSPVSDLRDPDLVADLAPLWTPRTPIRGDLGAAIVEAMSQHASRTPTLVIVDDADHIGPSASRLLEDLASMAAPLVVLTSGRAARREIGTAIELSGLEATHAGRLLERLSSNVVSDELRIAIHRTTGGIPALIERAAAQQPGRAIFAAALDGLSPVAAAVAQVLAVAGGPLVHDVVLGATQHGAEDVDAAIADAVGAGVLRTLDGERVDLTDAAREAVLSRIEPVAGLELHERLGVALLERDDVLGAAGHLLTAGERDPERAVQVAEQAARMLYAATMFLEAAELLGRAAALGEHHLGAEHPHVLNLLLGHAELLRRAGEQRHVDIIWEVVRRAEASGKARAVARAATALCSLGPHSEAGVFRQDVADVVERALASCDDPVLRAACAGQATLFYSLSGNVDRCRELFDDALESARRSGDDATVLNALGNVYASLSHPDDWPLRAELASEMLGLAERLDDDDARFQALHLYFSTQVIFSDPLLRTTFAAQEALAARLRSAARRWMAGYHRACLAHLDGRLEEALAIADDVFAHEWVSRSRQDATYWMLRLVCLPPLGRAAELLPDIDRAIETQPGLPAWRGPSAWVAALCGDTDRVRRECDVLECGRALPRDMPWSGAVALLGRAVARIGDVDRSARVSELLAPHAGLMTWTGSQTVGPFDLALAELSLVLGRPEEARAHLATAQRLCDRLQARVYQPELDAVAAQLGDR
jgi:DNA-binding SARP family transcriptional activator/tetratricopeptide (TPR) repeat protein